VDRIAIVGCGGSGKSWLARSLGGRLGVTPVHPDGLYCDQKWKPLDKEQFAALQNAEVVVLRSRRAARGYLVAATAQGPASARPAAAREHRG
jgi:ABC-type glutathione transport system ATPase component